MDGSEVRSQETKHYTLRDNLLEFKVFKMMTIELVKCIDTNSDAGIYPMN